MRQAPTRALALAAVATAASISSADVFITQTLPGQYISIMDTGTALNLADDGESARLNFTLVNHVIPQGQFVVGNNGGVGFFPFAQRESSDELDPDNQPLPSSNAFGGGQALLPFWDDPGADVGGVWYQQFGDRLIVEWARDFSPLPRGLETRGFGRWQVQIFDTSVTQSDVFAQFLYLDIEDPPALGGAIATIGYQDGGRGLGDEQWSFNQPGAVGNGTVLSLLAPIPAPGALPVLTLAGALRRRRR